MHISKSPRLNINFIIRSVLVGCGLLCGASVQAAEPLCFPWGTGTQVHTPTSPPVPHRVLSGQSTPNAVAVEPLPPKSPYSYGWFGSDPNAWKNSHWGRHFGYSHSYTQWTVR